MLSSIRLVLAVLAAALSLSPLQAEAADSAVFVSPEASLRLVADAPDGDGLIRAALVIDLAPGWKTYWRDPGDGGIPPTLDFSGSRNVGPATIRYPAPHRFGDKYGMFNGYSESIALALEMPQTVAGAATELRVKLMLGVCQTICIPVSTELSLALPAPAGAARVAAAFAALPAPNEVATGLRDARLSADGKTLVVQAAASVDPASDLFVAGPKGWAFGAPVVTSSEGGMVFTLPVVSSPRKPVAAPLLVDALLASSDGAMEVRDLAVGCAPNGSTAAP